ncbi:DMT family transporter [Polymorphobacter fuscus]|uniref:EamA family transporter n=1 Tax=Sandarakinorhabdus fusca TaxID=1439888 RepID=A0A7C9KX18_9SPHN|nr:DMT family transporter [Polymorphobacter fuscus]KAB7648954.1 DMT family transporter [Polymorphobacter fuscus]MQT16546.1 EamA family transporter [Polymorphobacter fuscus]NJC07163.1 S-adenosylmethionine uptake transporter [Polymorphobacter fuscus]
MSGRSFALVQCAAGIGSLCLMDVVVKHLAATTPVAVITLGRYVTGTLLALVVWQLQGRPAITRAMLPLHLVRGGLIASMAFAFYWSLKTLPLAEAITLSFIAPLLVPPFASLLLKERMQPRLLAAGALGFVGVLVTVQGAPRFDGDRLLALGAVLYAAVAYAGSAVLLRARAASDGATIVTLMGALVPMIILSPVAIGAAPVDAVTIGWLIAMGAIGNIGMQLLSRAYAQIEAQVLAVMEFTALGWAALFGWIFFAEPVRAQIWAGALVILIACLWAGRQPRPVTA